jgi:hypothetical protein
MASSEDTIDWGEIKATLLRSRKQPEGFWWKMLRAGGIWGQTIFLISFIEWTGWISPLNTINVAYLVIGVVVLFALAFFYVSIVPP